MIVCYFLGNGYLVLCWLIIGGKQKKDRGLCRKQCLGVFPNSFLFGNT